MEKIKVFLEKNYLTIIIVLFLTFLVSNCSNISKISSLKKETSSLNDSLSKRISNLEVKINSLPTQENVESYNRKLMYEFLIYEDDLDNRRTSLSKIKEELNRKN